MEAAPTISKYDSGIDNSIPEYTDSGTIYCLAVVLVAHSK